MIRFSVLICLSVVLFSTSAKPYGPREKVFGKTVQDTIESDDFDGKMILGMKEVEPPQDMDTADFDIDPSMAIWKAVKVSHQQKYNTAEEDKDALYHSFKIQKADSEQPDTVYQQLGSDRVQMHDKPEEDRDHLYHAKLGAAGHAPNEKFYPEKPMGGEKNAQAIGVKGGFMYLSPEEDKDGLYHAHVKGQQSDQHAPVFDMLPNQPIRVHTEPEVDMDHIYHK